MGTMISESRWKDLPMVLKLSLKLAPQIETSARGIARSFAYFLLCAVGFRRTERLTWPARKYPILGPG